MQVKIHCPDNAVNLVVEKKFPQAAAATIIVTCQQQ
jgi:hypothetical protein